MKFETLYIEQLNHHYCTARELQYGSDYGQFLSIDELNRFYDYLENCPDDFCKSLKVINLKSFNSKRIFFFKMC